MVRDELVEVLKKRLEAVKSVNDKTADPRLRLPVTLDPDELGFLLSEIETLVEERDYWQRVAGG